MCFPTDAVRALQPEFHWANENGAQLTSHVRNIFLGEADDVEFLMISRAVKNRACVGSEFDRDDHTKVS